MIVDLNLKGKNVVVFGGGREAARKVDGLLTQNCRITIVAEVIHKEIQGWVQSGKVQFKKKYIGNGNFINECNNLILVIAATDDCGLNRELVDIARQRGCYAYAVDDPEHSDFSHPAIINLEDTVLISLSTKGRSPLMARRLRERLEPLLKKYITSEDILLIELQESLRAKIKNRLPNPEIRKSFLIRMADDPKILALLAEKNLKEAEQHALNILNGFKEPL